MIRVMVVEDDPMVMNYNCRFIETMDGFQVAAQARNGAEAKDIIDDPDNDVDLVILDIFMPLMNGLEFLTAVRSEGNLVDVIFLTAANDTAMINRAMKLGLFDYLIKPFSYARFKEALENYRQFRETLHSSDTTTQEKLDAFIKSMPNSESARVIKGLHKETLARVRDYIDRCKDVTITQQELADALKLSKVTVRRYMEHLVSLNEVEMHIEYGSVGRPGHSYRKVF